MMVRYLKGLVVALSFILAACSTERESADTRAAINSVAIQDIQIQIEPGVYTGLPQLDNKSPQEQVREYSAALTYALQNQVIGKPGGLSSARLIVRLHQIDLASGIGRVIGGNGSSVSGVATIVDLKNPRRVIAVSPNLAAVEGTISGSGNIGVFVALAVKVVDAASEARTERMARGFANSVQNWLVPPR